MSRFHRLSHAMWYCHYHIVFVPKYRYRILRGEIKLVVEDCIRQFSIQLKCIIKEMNVQEDHVHLLVMVPPKISLSDYIGTIKGRAATRLFSKFPRLKIKPYRGNHFWARGYCIDTVGLDFEKVRLYVKYQEKKERLLEIKD